MRFVVAFAFVAAFVSSPAFAEGQCSKAPKDKWQSTATLEKKLVEEGFKVKRIKTEGGCYEVYAIDKSGKRANMAYNAETLAKANNAEAGE